MTDETKRDLQNALERERKERHVRDVREAKKKNSELMHGKPTALYTDLRRILEP